MREFPVPNRRRALARRLSVLTNPLYAAAHGQIGKKVTAMDMAVTLFSTRYLQIASNPICQVADAANRIRKSHFSKCIILRIGQRRQHGNVLNQPLQLDRVICVTWPGIVAESVRVSRPGEIRPGGDKLIGRIGVLLVQRMNHARRGWCRRAGPGTGTGCRRYGRRARRTWHVRKVRRCGLIVELICIHRDCRSEKFVERPLGADDGNPSRPYPRPIAGWRRRSTGSSQNLRRRPCRIRRRSIRRIDEV